MLVRDQAGQAEGSKRSLAVSLHEFCVMHVECPWYDILS